MKHTLKSGLAKTQLKLKGALPVILFFLLLFYSTIVLFGISYSLLVSVSATLFKINHRKCLTPGQLASLIGTQYLMALLSFTASLGLPSCIVLNLTVPFLLVFLKTTQFNQQGYFASAMCFVFLQLRPIGWEMLGMEMAALTYNMAMLSAALLICSLLNNKKNDFTLAQKGMLLLAKAVYTGIGSEGVSNQPAEDAFSILDSLYQEAYKSRGLTYVVSPRGKIQYLFALLFQRAVYFLTNPYQAPSLREESCHELLLRFAGYIESIGRGGFGVMRSRWAQTDQNRLKEKGEALMAEAETRDDIPYLFVQNFLRLFLLILEQMEQMRQREASQCWKLPGCHHPLRKLFHGMRLDMFETRFALRLSIVLAIGFSYSLASQANHGYWLALNAFLLLRPMYEESASRMKARFIGTIIGCVILQLLLPIFHGTGWHFVLASIMAVGLYMETAGTWQQAIFSTCFALTLTTLALPQALAAELRIVYVGMAIALVLLVNYFVFPTHQKGQFRYNLCQLFHMHHVYLRLLEDSLTNTVDYGIICDVQIHYHLFHNQILQYIEKLGNEEAAFIRNLLQISWRMISETEQMIFLIHTGRTKALDKKQMEDYLIVTSSILNDIQRMLDMGEEGHTVSGFVNYKRTMEGEPQLSALMEQYSKQLSRMYWCVCRRK